MHIETQESVDAGGRRVAVVVSRYHRAITDALADGARSAFLAAGGRGDDLTLVPAPGAFELTAITRALAGDPAIDGVVALGCIIRGETTHDQHLAAAIAHGLTQVTLATGTPVAFGVLTCQTLHQARERAGGEHGNKGVEAMRALLESMATLAAIARGDGAGVRS
ncbi:MAG: 6,7-dimethyl-8-ribityllumazine synthase [Phycisphaerales bacterium]|nr:6,7-dimethyl-8-ribityllumazine synthase [Phycisphaerales bacterium]